MPKLSTKEKIYSLAEDHFKKYGFNNMKTELLAKELGISKRTLYENIKSKEYLLESLIEKTLERVKLKVDSIIESMEDESSNIIDEIKKLWGLYTDESIFFNDALFKDIKKVHPHIWDKIARFRESEMKNNFSRIAKLGVKRGIFRNDMDFDIIYLIHLNAVQNILSPEVLYHLPISAKEVVRTIYEVLLAGVLTSQGRETYCNCCNETKFNI